MVSKNSTEEHILNEYKKFLSIIAHDFSAPLRHITTFSEMLVDSATNKLNEEEQEYLLYIENSASRLQAMHEDLINLARLTTHRTERETIDTNAIFKEVLSTQQKIISEKEAKIQIHSLPNIHVEKNHFVTLIKNIILNALTYHKEGEPPVIDIFATSENNDIIFCIKDQGIGIDEKYYRDIFDMFRRLTQVSPDGQHTGAGLKICKTIVENHGGKIWVTSCKDTGTQFFFSIPQKA